MLYAKEDPITLQDHLKALSSLCDGHTVLSLIMLSVIVLSSKTYKKLFIFLPYINR